ncbi:Bidirectional sugar transporter SWEET7 [Linum perenne]
MPSLNTIRNAVGIIGNIISLCLFLSPVPTFIQIWKKKSVEQFKPDPYLATLLNCMAWVVYGLPVIHPNSTLVVTINGAGTVIQLVYVGLYLIYSDKKKRVKVLSIVLLEIAFIVALLLLVVFLVHPIKKRSVIVGALCVVFCIMIYVAPLSVMIPNGIGVLLAVGQLILYAAFYKSTQRQIAERKAAEKGGGGGGELNLSQVGVAVDRNEDAYFNKAARNGAV